MLIRPLLIAIASALLLGVLASNTSATATDVTYQAPLTSDGDVLITFTPDLSGVKRAEVRNGFFEWAEPTTSETSNLRFSHHLFFDPPAPVTGGQFELTILDWHFTMARRDAVHIDATLADGQISGTAVLTSCVYPTPCFDLSSVDWSGGGIVSTPPAAGDTIYAGHIDGQNNSAVELSLNRGGNITSFALENVVAASCFAPPRKFNVRMFFDPAVSPSAGVLELVGEDIVPLTTAIIIDGAAISGHLVVGNSVAPATCTEMLPWSVEARAETPAALPAATPAAAPALPSTGGPQRQSATQWIALFGVFGTLVLAAGLVLRRRSV